MCDFASVSGDSAGNGTCRVNGAYRKEKVNGDESWSSTSREEHWALCDKYAVYVHDFLPISTRNFHCPFYLRTGRAVPWKILAIHVMGAPCIYAPMDGPIHKRGEMNMEGHFMGIQWPAALIKRKSDGKILNVSRKKIHVYESSYLAKLDQRVEHPGEIPAEAKIVANDFETTSEEVGGAAQDGGSASISTELALRPELDKNMVQSIKSLREHRFLLPGQAGTARAATKLDEAAAAEYVQFGGEGEYVDNICNENEFAKLTDLLEKAKTAAENGVAKPSIRSQVLAKLKSACDLAKYEAGDKGRLKVGKKVKLSGVSKRML